MADVVEVYGMEGGGRMVLFECPGCGRNHGMTVGRKNHQGAEWTFNGSREKPTLSPSVLAKLGPFPEGTKRAGQTEVCHFFLRDGVIQFLGDCTHGLKGQSVQLSPVPAASA